MTKIKYNNRSGCWMTCSCKYKFYYKLIYNSDNEQFIRVLETPYIYKHKIYTFPVKYIGKIDEKIKDKNFKIYTDGKKWYVDWWSTSDSWKPILFYYKPTSVNNQTYQTFISC